MKQLEGEEKTQGGESGTDRVWFGKQAKTRIFVA
jgi:hypothetical protein